MLREKDEKRDAIRDRGSRDDKKRTIAREYFTWRWYVCVIGRKSKRAQPRLHGITPALHDSNTLCSVHFAGKQARGEREREWESESVSVSVSVSERARERERETLKKRCPMFFHVIQQSSSSNRSWTTTLPPFSSFYPILRSLSIHAKRLFWYLSDSSALSKWVQKIGRLGSDFMCS